jgi:MoxR-like ATPase
MMRIRLGYPQRDEEVTVLDRQQHGHPFELLDQVASADDLVAAQAEVRQIHVAAELNQYIVDLAAATRVHGDVYLGASPRGSIALFRAAQARARLRGRDYVIPDDIKELAEPTLAHRLIINPSARVKGSTPSSIVGEILRRVPVPGTRVVA